MVIQPVGDKETYLVTNVYGPQRMDDKLKFLDSLMELRDRHVDVPWILCGDLNMSKALSEKKEGTRTLSRDSTTVVGKNAYGGRSYPPKV